MSPIGEIAHGDCLDVLGQWPAAFADLAYIDPPFNTGRVLRAHAAEFDDRWQDVRAYLDFLLPRLDLVLRALAPSGAILLHCDWRTSHHLRLALEERLGEGAFVNQLVWAYGLGGSSPRRFARKHDDILYYAKGPDYYFEAPRVPARSQRMRGQLKKATDVLDVPSINNMAAEREGYPTQKPLELLSLLINATCPPGGVVLDPFCGSGTALVAAARLGRSWAGIDSNERAVEISRKRLAHAAAPPLLV